MRLLTHNMLQCPRTQTYPLTLEIETCDEIDVTYSAAFVRRMLPRLNYPVFLSAARQLPDAQLIAQLPPNLPAADALPDDDPALHAVHRALLQWHVVEGVMRGPGDVVYRVSNGVPNLVITEVRAAQPVVGDESMEVEVEDGAAAADAES
eukprot:GFKZ01010678.1.p1 GENE.GFKZ01010678.1~~GFKZ01010678.1.p1  ORF type:complete len:167 (-),score=19.85 GFKZ01010678.1:74-523(-)